VYLGAKRRYINTLPFLLIDCLQSEFGVIDMPLDWLRSYLSDCEQFVTTLPPQSTSAVTSSRTPSLVGLALLLCQESANLLPEPTSPTALFAALLLLFGIH